MDLTHTNSERTKRRPRSSSGGAVRALATGGAEASAGAASKSRPRRTRERRRTIDSHKAFRVGAGIDMPFLILVIVLLVCGLIMMFSASYPIAYYSEGNSYYYLIRQSIFALIGIGVMFFMSYLNYEYLKKLSLIILPLGFIALIAVFFFPSSTGVHRWIDF